MKMEKDILNLIKMHENKKWRQFEEEQRYGRKDKECEAYGGYIAAREIREAVERLFEK